MSTATAGERESTLDLPSRKAIALAAYAVFWGYLVVRWVANWVGYREPFIPSAPFVAIAESLDAAASPTFVGGFVRWVSDLFAFVGLSVEVLPAIADGAWLTVVLTVVSIVLGLPLAVALAVGREYGNRPIRLVALGYTELIRGTPLLAQLFVVYFGMNLSQYFRGFAGAWGVLPPAAVFVAIVGFTINSAAYQGEYIRAALSSVERGQVTAARSVGLSYTEAIRHVVLPQGLRYAIPGWTNELVYLIKYSSLATFITVTELFTRTDAVANETFRYIDMYALAAVFYIALVLSANALMRAFEDRVTIPGLRADGR